MNFLINSTPFAATINKAGAVKKSHLSSTNLSTTARYSGCMRISKNKSNSLLRDLSLFFNYGRT